MSETPPSPATPITPRRRRVARWLLGISLAAQILFVPAAVGMYIYVLPKHPPMILGRWQYSLKYDNLVVFGLLALVVLGLALTMLSDAVGGRKLGARYVIIPLIQLLSVSCLLPVRSRPREHANRVKCAYQLRQIGRGIEEYASRNDGRWPGRFADLLRTDSELAESFVCPSSNDQRPIGDTREALLADFALPGRCSYVYRGSGLRQDWPPRCILAHDRLENHQSSGIHVLWNDGSVQWVAMPDAQQVLSELDAGQNPPRASR